MDEAYTYNKQRWETLVQAQALFTRPWLGLDAVSARERLDPYGLLGDLSGKTVLCLAGGGGQQSVAFGLLGARVSVLDIAEGQLANDREAAAEYGLQVQTYQGDMRDLSAFEDAAFDIVWHPYALNFVPDCRDVFKAIARVLRPNGFYHFMAANPFAAGIGPNDWSGAGYIVRRQYIQGQVIDYVDPPWVFNDHADLSKRPTGPREYRQTLGCLLNGLIENHFVVMKLLEYDAHEQKLDAEPGEWHHFASFLPPWLSFWALYRPDLVFTVERPRASDAA
ncbi:MAG TPA: class I SAM-dependent methyltransferase [Roseiflexaceae bacterium]|nr:class I SAM-dependent methyltransferase [Roseiflexaceae bacterium]